MITIDTSRIQASVDKINARATQATNFMNNRLLKLSVATPYIEDWAAAVKASDVAIGNMYSTGHDESAYTEEAYLKVCVSMVLDREPKNKNVKATFLHDKFMAMVAKENPDLKSVILGYRIKGQLVNFEINIK